MTALVQVNPRLDAAQHYRSIGWWCVPVPLRAKRPVDTGWPQLRLEGQQLNAAFSGPGNIGVIVGNVSGGLADVDLDSPEAVELAPRFLPITWTYGRQSKPRSHWLYTVPGGCTPRAGPRAFKDATKNGLFELRSNRDGDSSLQTIIPPGVHTSGEPIEWTADDCDGTDAPLVMDAANLTQCLDYLYAAVLLRRHAPGQELAWLATGDWPPVDDALTRLAWPGAYMPPTRPQVPRTHRSGATVADAVAAYNRDHTLELPRPGSSTCPMCGHHGCFGRLASNEGRWACMSASHSEGGIQGEGCWHGDMLDLDAHSARLGRVELLRRDGYLGARR